MDDWLCHNMPALERRFPALARQAAEPGGGGVRVEASRSGLPTMLLDTDSGQLSLHSRFDPRKEAETLVKDLQVPLDGLLVILGLGLAYHLKAALRLIPPETPLVVIEADWDVFRAALRQTDLTSMLDRPALDILVGLPPDDVLKELTRFQLEHSFPGMQILAWPPCLRARPEYYGMLKDKLESHAENGLGQRLAYSRLKRDQVRILLVDTGYFLVREIASAARALGHEVRLAGLAGGEDAPRLNIKTLLTEAAEFQPDFLLTVNHLGFDAQGALTDVLTRLRLPYASWFVDSPLLILPISQANVSGFCSIFVWDEDYVPGMKALGFGKVHHLPLGTDENIFKPLNGHVNHMQHLSCSVGFAGDSMTNPVWKKIGDLRLPAAVLPQVEAAAREFIASPDICPHVDLEGPVNRFFGDSGADPERILAWQALVTWRATQVYRLGLVKALAPLEPVIVGDRGWDELLNRNQFRLEEPIGYYNDLPCFYQVCRINLNVTSRQMKAGLNQRVFDVPACGSFVLTDSQKQLEGMFRTDREMVCYESPEEALDKARFYLSHDQARRQIAARGYERVLKEHTYRHRLASLIKEMRRDHRS